jgi:hypothetical protein
VTDDSELASVAATETEPQQFCDLNDEGVDSLMILIRLYSSDSWFQLFSWLEGHSRQSAVVRTRLGLVLIPLPWLPTCEFNERISQV